MIKILDAYIRSHFIIITLLRKSFHSSCNVKRIVFSCCCWYHSLDSHGLNNVSLIIFNTAEHPCSLIHCFNFLVNSSCEALVPKNIWFSASPIYLLLIFSFLYIFKRNNDIYLTRIDAKNIFQTSKIIDSYIRFLLYWLWFN